MQRRLQYDLRGLLVLTALVAIATTVAWNYWLVLLVSPIWLTGGLILTILASPARDQSLDVRSNPWFVPIVVLTALSWLAVGGVLLWLGVFDR